MSSPYTHAEKWLVELADGRSVFVKAATEPSAQPQVEREAALLASVAAPYMPYVHGASTVDGWAVLVLEDLSRAHWPPPYEDRGEALLDTVRQVAATTPPPGLERRPEGRPFGTYWQRIADDPEPCWLMGSSPRNGSKTPSQSFTRRSRQHGSLETTSSTMTSGRGTSATRSAAQSSSTGHRCVRSVITASTLPTRCYRFARPEQCRRRSSSPTRRPTVAPLAGSCAFQAAQPVDESIKHESVLRAGWLHDLEYALEWACELLQLSPPRRE